MSKSPVAAAREALRAAAGPRPAPSSPRSRKDFTRHRPFAALALRQFLRAGLRGVAATPADSFDLRREPGLAKVPHDPTLGYAARRPLNEGASSASGRRPSRAPATAA